MTAQTKTLTKIFIFCAFAFGIIFFTCSTANAATSVSASSVISAIPTRLDLKADPGQTITADVKVNNGSNKTQTYAIAIQDFVVYDSIGTPIPIAPSSANRWAMKGWISAPGSIPVDSQQTQTIKLTIKVPLTALHGGHYAMITYEPNPGVKPADLKKTANLIGQRVGTLIYLTVSGPITQNATLTKFTTADFHEKGPIDFQGTVRNLSDIHVNPTGTLDIYNFLNQKVASLPVQVGNVFPEISRDFTTSWNQKWGYGRYRADLNLAYGTTGGILTSSIYFWFFPISLIIYLLLLIISILALIILLNRRSNKHQQELEKEVEELKGELKEAEQK